MAKGIRSKAMRKNRSYLRKTLVEPIMQKRQEKIAESLRRTVAEAEDKSSLMKLKSVLGTSTGPESFKGMQETDDEMADNGDEMIMDDSKPNHAVNTGNQLQMIRGGKQIERIVRGGRSIEVVKLAKKKNDA